MAEPLGGTIGLQPYLSYNLFVQCAASYDRSAVLSDKSAQLADLEFCHPNHTGSTQ